MKQYCCINKYFTISIAVLGILQPSQTCKYLSVAALTKRLSS